MDLHVFPIPPGHPWALVLCIQPGLAICFTLDNIHVSMPFSPSSLSSGNTCQRLLVVQKHSYSFIRGARRMVGKTCWEEEAIVLWGSWRWMLLGLPVHLEPPTHQSAGSKTKPELSHMEGIALPPTVALQGPSIALYQQSLTTISWLTKFSESRSSRL